MQELIDRVYMSIQGLTGIPNTRNNAVLMADVFLTLEKLARMIPKEEPQPDGQEEDKDV